MHAAKASGYQLQNPKGLSESHTEIHARPSHAIIRLTVLMRTNSLSAASSCWSLVEVK